MADIVHKLLVIEEGNLTAMASNDTITREFPFIKSVQLAPQRRSGCRSCGSSGGLRAETYMTVKRLIAGLASDKKQRLKQLLNAKSIRVIYRTSDNRTISLTF